MKRKAVLDKIKRAAHARGLAVEVEALSRHDAVKVGATRRTIGRHSEVDEVTAGKFFAQWS